MQENLENLTEQESSTLIDLEGLQTHPEDLKIIGEYEKLFSIARQSGFLDIQKKQSSPDNDLCLKTLETALEGAKEIDDATRMAEFLLRYARQRSQSLEDFINPLDALRSSNLGSARILNLIDSQNSENSILWHILLAWEAADSENEALVAKILEHLMKGEIVEVGGQIEWHIEGLLDNTENLLTNEAKWVATALAKISRYAQDMVLELQSKIFDDELRFYLCQDLCENYQLEFAEQIIEQIDSDADRARALTVLAKFRSIAGQAEIAQNLFKQALALAEIIQQQEWKGFVLGEIAQNLAQIECYEQALAVAEHIQDTWERVWILLGIVNIQVQADALEPADSSCSLVLQVAEEELQQEQRDKVLVEVVGLQAHLGAIDEAKQTAAKIESEWEQSKALAKIVQVYAEAGELKEALLNTWQIEHDGGYVLALAYVGQAQADKDMARTILEAAIVTSRSEKLEKEKEIYFSLIREIAISFTKIGLYQEALKIVYHIRQLEKARHREATQGHLDSDAYEKSIRASNYAGYYEAILRDIIKIQAEDGYAQEAIQESDYFHSDKRQRWILREIAQLQIKASKANQARQTIAKNLIKIQNKDLKQRSVENFIDQNHYKVENRLISQLVAVSLIGRYFKLISNLYNLFWQSFQPQTKQENNSNVLPIIIFVIKSLSEKERKVFLFLICSILLFLIVTIVFPLNYISLFVGAFLIIPLSISFYKFKHSLFARKKTYPNLDIQFSSTKEKSGIEFSLFAVIILYLVSEVLNVENVQHSYQPKL